MELMMYLSNELIDVVRIEKSLIPLPGYVGDSVRLLRQRHELLIRQRDVEPEFLIRHCDKQKSHAFLRYRKNLAEAAVDAAN